MGRRSKNPLELVAPVSSKKQLLTLQAVCTLMGGISPATFERIRNDADARFPKPLQIMAGSPRWSLDQYERWISRSEKQVEAMSA